MGFSTFSRVSSSLYVNNNNNNPFFVESAFMQIIENWIFNYFAVFLRYNLYKFDTLTRESRLKNLLEESTGYSYNSTACMQWRS